MTTFRGAKCGFATFTILAFLMALFSLAVAIAAMAHSQWIHYNVVSANFGAYLPNYTRYRGMFLECPVDSTADILFQPSVTDQLDSPGCFQLDMGKKKSTDPKYWYIVQLRRTHVGMFTSGLFCVLVGILFTLGALFMYMCSGHGMRAYRGMSFFGGVCFILGGLAYIVSFLVFHIGLDEETFNYAPELPWIASAWPADLLKSTTVTYNVGYGLGWAACISAFLSGMGLWISYCLNAHGDMLRTRETTLASRQTLGSGQVNPTFHSSDYLIAKDSVGTAGNPDVYYERSGQLTQRAPDQESHYSSKNIYRIY